MPPTYLRSFPRRLLSPWANCNQAAPRRVPAQTQEMLKTLDRVFHRLSAPQVYSLFLKERRRIPKTIPVCMLALLNTVLAESTLIYQGHTESIWVALVRSWSTIQLRSADECRRQGPRSPQQKFVLTRIDYVTDYINNTTKAKRLL